MPITKAKTDSSKLISLMFIIGRSLREQMRQAAKDQSCSLLHFEALQYVDDEGKPLMRDVAEHFMITPPAATLLIDGLVASKLLTRSFDKKDRRAVRISITPKGKHMLARGVEERMQKIRQIFSVLNADERVELARILEKIGKTKHI
jgi:DNA-binding MarR family transcriptional regulator